MNLVLKISIAALGSGKLGLSQRDEQSFNAMVLVYMWRKLYLGVLFISNLWGLLWL